MNWAALIPDRFVMVLFGTIIFASFVPLRGQAAEIGSTVSAAAIFLLFLLHGLRLPRAEVVQAIRDWRLQAIIALFVFAFMPLVGLSASWTMQGQLPAGLVTGLIFVGLLPSTVQSAISYSSLAGGNIAASVVASALLNLAAIIITPLLVILTIGLGSGDSGAANGGALVGKIMLILLLPFCLGQLLQGWFGAWAKERKTLLGFMDKSAIATAVYVAFSSAVAGGLWQTVSATELALLCGVVMVMLLLAFGGSWLLGGALKLARKDRISMMFSGSHKSIATGAPMAALIFAGPEAGMVILPALIYHQIQLIISAPLANRLQRPVLRSAT
ncbi:bile acid:sodium symporter family protein [Alterisphingorhabdus coralli]|uniref:Bile acid:sodium symporter family protein n=1 Tax=Alterisphingorhabdus coralli TaxID=3071408 RepID=A0AA97I2U3_9SPHN|nr:bile acid:sodium symporter family protein [Parasphingorhabdus sp. SCSIO 66989]WOE76070.1 bile acid:sodium symporter family protein [Parasphingorhabdus sp. SCSIO 66989]